MHRLNLDVSSRAALLCALFAGLVACGGDDGETPTDTDTGISDDTGVDTDVDGDTTEDTGDGDTSDTDVEQGPQALQGTFTDDWGGAHRISEDLWLMGWAPEVMTFHITEYSNADGWILAENDADNAWNPSLWSRFDWTESAGATYFCQSAYDAADADAARAAGADPADLATGCGGFAWSLLTEGQGDLAIVGDYQDPWGGPHFVGLDDWTQSMGDSPSVFTYSEFSNAEQWIVAENDGGNPYNAGLWSRFDWAWDGMDLYYCQTAYDAADEAAARAATADPSDLGAGCGGFSWSLLAPYEPTASLAIAGTYENEINQLSWFSDDMWVISTGAESDYFVIDGVDNDAQAFVALNGPFNTVPDAYTRVDWTTFSDMLYVCQTVTDAATAEDAWATPAADGADRDGGCPTGWRVQYAVDPIAVAGEYSGPIVISSVWWQYDALGFVITEYDNDDRWALAQNATGNAEHPELWSRFDWADVDGVTYACHTVQDAENGFIALGAETPDSADLTTGCVGGPWMVLE